MRVEIRTKSGHLFLANRDQNGEEVDLQTLFNDYWTLKEDKFTVPRQS